MKKVSSKLLTLNNKQFIVFSFLLSLIITIVTNIILNLLYEGGIDIESDLMNQHISIIFLFVVLIGPFIETLIFQFIVIELSLSFIKNKKIILFISAFLFGLVHIFNNDETNEKILYFGATFSSGLVWAFIYLLAKKRKNINPFLLIFSIHMFENLIGFVINKFG